MKDFFLQYINYCTYHKTATWTWTWAQHRNVTKHVSLLLGHSSCVEK